ncbi:hypothetical protein VV02_14710 [Luteipulveratus mongoliensis]|uniref:YibE/F family protein n=1 Tax=Luteipulveratus mongoliensis TaxID=571913 RepID=A0A0K1JQE2_9MICO|nr:hypothetical protein VV02_14710 [Luteipulveratus mongoliensis]
MEPPLRRNRAYLQEARDTRRTALRLLAAILVPVALLTIAGLVLLWPDSLSSHVRKSVTQVSSAGTTTVAGTITFVKPMSCSEAGGGPGGAGDGGGAGDSEGAPAPSDASSPSSGASGDTSPENRCAVLSVDIRGGPEKGKAEQVTVDNVVLSTSPKAGQKVRLARSVIPGQPVTYEFADFERGLPLALIAALFAVVVIGVARWRGLLALVGLGFGAAILTWFVFPGLVGGENPVLVGLVGCLAIMFVVLYCTHGFSVRTTTALLGTVFGLGLSALLGWGATSWTHLTGAATDDDYLLGQAAPDMRLTAVVVCGMIIAGMGVLNDVTITQASAVWELAEAGETDRRSLFRRAMRIGRDHIASTVYTIAFAWAGASLGTLLLISVYDRPLLDILQSELIAAEVLSTLVGSVALVLSVPVTTGVAVALVGQAQAKTSRRGRRTPSAPTTD